MGGVFRSLWRRQRRPNRIPSFGPAYQDIEYDDNICTTEFSSRGFTASLQPLVSFSDSGCQFSRSAVATFSNQTPQLSDLVIELRMVNWHQLGIQLQLPPDKLDKIEEDYPSAERRLSEVLQYWLDDEKNPSWDKVCEALRRIGGFARIVHGLKVKYCSLSELRSTICHRHQQCKLFDYIPTSTLILLFWVMR